VDPSSGYILFDDQVMNRVPTNKRNIGLAFQSHALFPHMSVAKNIAFGLTMKRRPKAEIRNKVEEMLDLIEMTGYGDRMPAQLSGGQQQRVALARMLATDPRVLLFDEPLSALDRNLRDTLKYSILELQRRTKKTAIYVTHDQSEAFAISDRIFVMNQGRVEQAGSQLDIYLRPATEFVANFVGDNNAISGVIESIASLPDGQRTARVKAGTFELQGYAPDTLDVGDEVLAFVRPENIEVVGQNTQQQADGLVSGMVEQIVFEGPTVRLNVDCDGVLLNVSASGVERLTLLDKGEKRVTLRFRDVSLVKQ
ncbi:MAG: ABC transporter ATP-binding protein, partial [Thermomicrobiales bacterium]|nr:ABC transporter ATP-binding protein [Thermomicrobiales bacterium]